MLAQEQPQAASKALVDRANSLGGNDNVTVIVARVEHEEAKKTARRGGRADEAKTVQLKDAGGPPRTRHAGRLLLRLLLSPVLLLIWLSKIGARGFWAILKRLFSRRR